MFAFPCLNHSIPSTRIFMVHLKTNHNAKETSKSLRKGKPRGRSVEGSQTARSRAREQCRGLLPAPASTPLGRGPSKAACIKDREVLRILNFRFLVPLWQVEIARHDQNTCRCNSTTGPLVKTATGPGAVGVRGVGGGGG